MVEVCTNAYSAYTSLYVLLQDGTSRKTRRQDLFLRYMARSRYHMQDVLRKATSL